MNRGEYSSGPGEHMAREVVVEDNHLHRVCAAYHLKLAAWERIAGGTPNTITDKYPPGFENARRWANLLLSEVITLTPTTHSGAYAKLGALVANALRAPTADAIQLVADAAAEGMAIVSGEQCSSAFSSGRPGGPGAGQLLGKLSGLLSLHL